jgi:hypothetical protein
MQAQVGWLGEMCIFLSSSCIFGVSTRHSVVALASSRRSDGYQTCLINTGILMVPYKDVDDGGSGPREQISAWFPNRIDLKAAIPDIQDLGKALTQCNSRSCYEQGALGVGEGTVDTVTVPVPMQVDLREATIEADIRSPGRPMSPPQYRPKLSLPHSPRQEAHLPGLAN